MSSFWEDLGQKGVEEILKVVIVFFLYFILWVSGLCNNFNIVSGAGWKRKNLLALTSIITVSRIVKYKTIECKSLESVGYLEQNTEYVRGSLNSNP